jgi:hypothetical protein
MVDGRDKAAKSGCLFLSTWRGNGRLGDDRGWDRGDGWWEVVLRARARGERRVSEVDEGVVKTEPGEAEDDGEVSESGGEEGEALRA